MMGEAVLCIEVYVYRLFPFDITDPFYPGRWPRDASIVYQNIQPIRPLSLYLKDTLNLIGIRNIG
ncbi:hypothetical protein D3C75_838530 [compost metagenome]